MSFREFRKNLRGRLNRARLEKELSYYESLFSAKGLSLPDDESIQTIINQRYPRPKPKQKGELSILALYHHYNWENHSLKPALEKFGLVRHYDWCPEFDHQRRDWYGPPRLAMNRELIGRVRKWVREDSTDVIFTYLSGEQVLPQTVAELSSLGIPLVNIALNDKESFVGKIRGGQAMGSRDICRHFSLCWTSTEDALKKYCVEGATPLYLPEGANPDVHKPYNLPRTLDVSFVGQCYGSRPAILEKLEVGGIRVEAFGSGWPNGPLSVDEMIKTYSRSRINLGFGGILGYRDAFCLKGRDFEIPMSGGFYLTEFHPELERAYRVGSEIAVYTGIDELIRKIRYYLANPHETESIRLRGFERARRDHTWEVRFEKIFRLLGLI